MKKNKICFVTREYAHDKMGKTGGIGVFLKQFTSVLKNQGFDITIFSFGEKKESFNDEGVNVLKIKDLSSFNEWVKKPLRRYKVPGYISIKLFLEFLNRLYISFKLSRFLEKYHIDIIELHDYGGDVPYFKTKKPVIIRCHGSALTLYEHMQYVNRVSDSIFEKKIFKKFKENIIAVSKYSASKTQKSFALKRQPKIIYNGVNLPKIIQKPYYLDTPTIEFSIFYFGSIRERKGIDIACEIFNQVIEIFPKATFHVLGNNNNNHWNLISKPSLAIKAQKQTVYYGAIPNEQINDYLKKAHVVLFPSYGENFSIALLEVMALSKLAIVSEIQSFSEIIKHAENGFIAQNFEDYVEIISSIFNKEVDIESIQVSARKTIKDNFLLEDKIQENICYYKKILA